MARPGFNAVHWFDLPFDEAVLLGWLGQFSTGSESLEAFRAHLGSYAPKIYRFYNLNDETGSQAIKIFDDVLGLQDVGERLAKRTQILDVFRVSDERLHFTMSEKRLHKEIEFLKGQNIETVVSLTEHHHSRDMLDDRFETHHFAIKDLSAPELDQVLQLADVLKVSRKNNKRLAVHCLAGIGRTSTMLLAAHIALGENIGELTQLIARQNPTFVLTGSQGEFIQKIADQFGKTDNLIASEG